MDHLPNLTTRRNFFRQAACAAVGTFSLSATLRDLRLINTAAAQSQFSDYKALVCIFMAGGNDCNNLIIPNSGQDYTNYSAARQILAIPQANLAATAITQDSNYTDGRNYSFHPSCTRLSQLFTEGRLNTLFNVGPLVYPMTRTQYTSGSVPRPPQLFSHSDQVTHWQTSLPDQPPRTGWGGRVADLLHPGQYQLLGDGSPSSTSAKIALCSSLAGANTFEVGDTFAQYHVSTSGAVTLSGVTGAQLTALQDLLAVPSNNLQRKAFAGVTKNSIDVGQTLNTAIAPTTLTTYWNELFPTTSLGNQLRMVARLIEARDRLNMKRQIFFVSVGGYDTHNGQINFVNGNPDTTAGGHVSLLTELSNGIYAFQRAMEQLTITEKVTAFTASDFGRTLPSNGQGSDHGWGSHHMIIGGAVKPRRVFGRFPVLQIGGPDDTSTGRWIPSTSVDEYSATLASWFGVENTHLATVFPNIGRFATPNLGFLNAT